LPICPIDTGRYGSLEMKRIFEEENRLQKFLDVESAVAYAQAEVGIVPKEAAEEIAEKANTRFVTLKRCKEIEAEIGHDLMAVVKALTEACKGEGRKWVHFGLTSYDVEDSATALQFREAIRIIEKDLIELQEVLLELTQKYRNTVMPGRTHGQHINVITLGFKFAVWMREIARHIERLREAEKRVLVGKILGAVGTGACMGERALKVQEIALRRLGLKPADMVTQIVQRDVHAELISILALIACSLDKFALEIRNLQRTEIQEVAEPFKIEKQVGSSAMPAKRNPEISERICSLAKLMRSLVIPAYENIPLWHERDLTNSANERFIFPTSFILLDEMLREMKYVLQGLEVFPENMRRNLELTFGLILSERVSVKLVEKGLGRQESHELVRQCAMRAMREKVEFKKALMQVEEISSRLSEAEIDECLDYNTYLGVTQQLIDNAVKLTRQEISSIACSR
jgi:adenylosuccinate lyase